MQTFAIALLGLWLIVQAVLGEVQHESTLILSWASASPDIGYAQPAAQERWSPRLTNSVEAAVGILLLLGASGVLRAWKALRFAGHDRT